MGAAVVNSGRELHGRLPGPGCDMHFYQVDTATNGEDGVTIAVPCAEILGVFVGQNEGASAVVATATWSGTTVTVTTEAGATGDAKEVSVLVFAIP